jgi:aryl-alcohol dehydrogenase-like predicted oxidoreductase
VDAAAMRAGVERSLRRLGVECLDLLQLHHPSARVPIEDSMGVLNDLRARGLTHHVGVCNVTLTQLRRAEQAGPIATVQNHLHVRRVTPASVRLIEYCASQGVAFLAYQPLAQGLLLTDAALSETAEQRGIGVIEALLGPLLRLADNVIPIPGSGTARHVREIVESYWAHERRAPPRALA